MAFAFIVVTVSSVYICIVPNEEASSHEDSHSIQWMCLECLNCRAQYFCR